MSLGHQSGLLAAHRAALSARAAVVSSSSVCGRHMLTEESKQTFSSPLVIKHIIASTLRCGVYLCAVPPGTRQYYPGCREEGGEKRGQRRPHQGAEGAQENVEATAEPV